MMCVFADAVDAEQRRGLAFERLAGHEAGAGIVLSLDDAGRSLCQHLGNARLMQIEILRTRRIEQGEHAHDAFRRVAHRAGQDLVRRRDVARHLGDMIDDDRALLQLHPGHQMMLRTLQRLRRHGRAAARQRQRDVFIRHPQCRQRAAHAFEAGLHDEAEFVGIARGRRLMRRNFHQEIEIAFAHIEVAFAGAQFRTQRELAPQALQCRLHQLANGLQGPRLRLLSRQAGDQADDPQQLDVLAANREAVHGAVGVQGAHDSGIFHGIRQRIRDGFLDDAGLVRQIPFVRCPNQIGEAVMHDHAAQTRHEHSQQPAIGVERGVRGRVLGDGRLHIQHCGHILRVANLQAHGSMCGKGAAASLTSVPIQRNGRGFPPYASL